MSLDGGAEGGTVTTKPFTITGAACPTCNGNYDLFVNMDARGGTASVSLLDASAEGCGSARATSTALSGDLLREEVEWTHPAAAKGLANKSLCLQFHLVNASLYSYWWQ